MLLSLKATGVAGASSKPLTADVNIILPETRAERLERQAINGKEKWRRTRRRGEREGKGEGEMASYLDRNDFSIENLVRSKYESYYAATYSCIIQ